jgi:hypothetical protein
LPDAAGKILHRRNGRFGLERSEDLDEAEHGAQQAHQRRKLGDGGEQVEFVFEWRHFDEAGFFEGFAHAVAALVAVQDRDLHEARDRTGRGVADGDGFDDVVALEDVAHAVEELDGVDLGAMEMQHAFNEHDHARGAGKQDDPDHRAALE